MIDHAECQAEKDRYQTGKKDEKGNISCRSVLIQNSEPDICFVTAENRIDNTGIIISMGCQFDAEFFAGIGLRSLTENITAGRVFAGQSCLAGVVRSAQCAIDIEFDILKGGTNGHGILVIVFRKTCGKYHCLTHRQIISPWDSNFFRGSIRLLPGKSTGVDHGI